MCEERGKAGNGREWRGMAGGEWRRMAGNGEKGWRGSEGVAQTARSTLELPAITETIMSSRLFLLALVAASLCASAVAVCTTACCTHCQVWKRSDVFTRGDVGKEGEERRRRRRGEKEKKEREE